MFEISFLKSTTPSLTIFEGVECVDASSCVDSEIDSESSPEPRYPELHKSPPEVQESLSEQGVYL